MKKWIGAVLTASFIIQSSYGLGVHSVKAMEIEKVEAKTTKAPDIFGSSGVAIDAYSGKLLYSKNANQKAYPASITKVMTAILVDENLDPDDTITFSKRAAEQEPSNQQILYKEGEKISVEDALESLIIISSNDVAFALAEKVAGSVENFAEMMNERARELGAKDTHFVTPNGLPNEDHYTTAHDMALFGKEAATHPHIVEKMSQREAVIKTDERSVTIKSPNSIPKSNPKSIGGKTGYTNAAQHTLIEVLQDGEKKVIAVTMHSSKEGKYSDMNTMSEYAFDKIKTKKLFQNGEIFHIFEMDGEEYPLILKEDVIVSSFGETIDNLSQDIKWNTRKKQFESGDTVAWLVIKNGEEEISRFALETDKTFKPNSVIKDKKNMSQNSFAGPIFPSNSSSSYIWTIASIFLVPFFTFILLNVISNKKRKRRVGR